MSTIKQVLSWIGVSIAVLIILFLLGFYFLGWSAYFGPRFVNVQRTIFTHSQSYQQGKMQDLARYYQEYQEKTDPQARGAIKAVIRAQFADFDKEIVTVPELKWFLVEMRGF